MAEIKKKLVIELELVVVVGIFLLFTFLFIFFRNELQNFVRIFVGKFGLPGLFLITFLMDTIIQPVSPDLLTMGYTMSRINIFIVSLVGGSGSILAGLTGYGIGYFLRQEGIDRIIGKKRYRKAHNLFVKYGFWAILIGALSPVPFSSICWSAGVFRMPLAFFFVSIIVTRMPRFLLAGFIGNLLG